MLPQSSATVDVEGFHLERNLPPGTYVLTRVVHGFENSPALRRLFPSEEERETVLRQTKVSIVPGQGYMRVDPDGIILVAQEHLRSSDERVVYLDFVHELVHVQQAKEGRTLYDRSVRYVDKETEIEAYRVAVDEGRRIGMSEKELRDYLEVPWITEDEFQKLVSRLGVGSEKPTV
jgi:hypothetical protein